MLDVTGLYWLILANDSVINYNCIGKIFPNKHLRKKTSKTRKISRATYLFYVEISLLH